MDLFNKKKLAILQEENNNLKRELEKLKLTKSELNYLNLTDELKKLEELVISKKESIESYQKNIIDLQDLASLETRKLKSKEEIISLNKNIDELKIQKNSLHDESMEIKNKILRDSQKLSKIKPLYLAIQKIINEYPQLDIFNDNIQEISLSSSNIELYDDLAPTVTLKLHSMDVKSLRKELNITNKAIDKVLEQYEKRYTTKSNLTIYRLMVIALRAELQNILSNLRYDKLDKSISDLKIITQKYLSIANDGNKQLLSTITKFINEIEYLFIQCINIEYEYYQKKQREKEEQAAIREQMKQEAEERKILAKQQKQVEKEEEKYKNEICKIQEQIIQSDDENKLLELQNKIYELQNQLNKVEEKKDEIISRQNGKAGYVYIISNLGSFGENVFKVGMTRRLEPMDRINELSNASVPFSFDVHSFIFSEDAVGLEHNLHKILDKQRVNKINLRKEFFRTDIESLKDLVEKIDPSAEFTVTMLAEQYRDSLEYDIEQAV
ncbi:GIY-YIG nuclease family protein [Clostridium sp. LY3-2]|uniref:GIY-YIG nuclease family protein n=1 Tax=Clostridium sp. LY3-2 TaxID=2942482 RepID=UPI0021534822|nr:GIY-YIG nuclease family protein [Clostridium sp. LY3-2]MCR6515833.1 GIY-YIG nuclease family protein [Clostridium sp. LY3-2]